MCGIPINWVKVYEIDKIIVRLRHGHFNEDLVRRIIECGAAEVFDVDIVSPTKLKLEFINSEARKLWFSQRNLIKSNYNVLCWPEVRQIEHN